MNRYSCLLFTKPSFLGGLSKLFDLGGTLNNYNLYASGNLADMRAFQEDWNAIGDDMRNTLTAYQYVHETQE
ncbi:MAG: hypothetical protein KJ882_04990 [Proteobacteria bacterium]|nr:hypothetical protein [Pseudomonadota bacterium]MBU4035453.1 hypothetical protein [Pseudomonadota bacterium]